MNIFWNMWTSPWANFTIFLILTNGHNHILCCPYVHIKTKDSIHVPSERWKKILTLIFSWVRNWWYPFSLQKCATLKSSPHHIPVIFWWVIEIATSLCYLESVKTTLHPKSHLLGYQPLTPGGSERCFQMLDLAWSFADSDNCSQCEVTVVTMDSNDDPVSWRSKNNQNSHKIPSNYSNSQIHFSSVRPYAYYIPNYSKFDMNLQSLRGLVEGVLWAVVFFYFWEAITSICLSLWRRNICNIMKYDVGP